MEKSTMLRKLLDEPGVFIAPGVYDALSARIVQEAGFEMVYVSGQAMAASYGLPDLGLLTMSEVVSRAASITEAVDIPVICDADTGYGDAINVIRTVREFERAGVAGIHLEDQVSSKRCGMLSGKSLISMEEMVAKLHAALDARVNQDFVIIARTDALLPVGTDEAIKRAKAYEEAGADLIMLQTRPGPVDVNEFRTLLSPLTKPQVQTVSTVGVKPTIPLAELSTMGVKILILSLIMEMSAITGMRQAMREIKQSGLEGVIRLFESNDSWDSIRDLAQWNRVFQSIERYSVQATDSKQGK